MQKFDNPRLTNAISRIEDNLSIRDLNIDGINYWPAIRLAFCFQIISSRYQRSSAQGLSGGLHSSKLFPNVINEKDLQAKVLFVTHDIYKIDVEGSKYDRVLQGHICELQVKREPFAILNLSDGSITFFQGEKKLGVIFISFGRARLLSQASVRLFGNFKIRRAIREVNRGRRRN